MIRRSRDLWRQRPYTVLLALLILGLAIPFLTRKRSDWDQVYVPAAVRMTAGEDVFQQGYAYPPASAWLAQPFVHLSQRSGRALWYVLNVVALLVIVRSAWGLSGGGRLEGGATSRKEHLILWLGLAGGIGYALDALTNQQNDLVIVALVLLGCIWLSRGQTIRSGASFGLAAGIKCTPLLFAAYLIWRGRLLAAGVLVGVALLVNLVPDWTHPSPHPEGRLSHWVQTHLKPMGKETYHPGQWMAGLSFNHSIAGVVHRWSTAEHTWASPGPGIVSRQHPLVPSLTRKIVLASAAILMLLALGAAGWKEKPTEEDLSRPAVLEYSLVMALMVLLSPMSSKPHFTILILPALCLARVAVQRSQLAPRILLGGAILAGLISNKDLVGRQIYDHATWYGSVFWSALLLLVGCGWVLATQRKTPEPQVSQPSELPRLAA